MPNAQPVTDARWPVSHRLGFLLLLIYITLYALPFVMDEFVIWAGKTILQLDDITTRATGSGDSAFSFVKVLIIAFLSLILAPLVLLIDRKRRDYHELRYWFFTGIRYYTGIFMLIYGFAKVFLIQFSAPDLVRLDQSYGDSSPMGLLWTFMGYSPAYTIFTGLAEVVSGFLLFFRRTAVLGALIVIAVMTHVLMLNLCYDVPVKLFSMHLVLFASILFAPNAKNVYRFFILNKPAALSGYDLATEARYKDGAIKKARIILKSLLFIAIGVLAFKHLGNLYKHKYQATAIPLRGIYHAEMVVLNADTLPPAGTDSTRWRKLIIDRSYAVVHTMAEERLFYNIRVDTIRKTLDMTPHRKNTDTGSYRLSYADMKGGLHLSGQWKQDSIAVTFTKQNMKKYLLMNRGFHWISEYPFNR